MRRALTVLACLSMTACSLPFQGKSSDDRKANCDGIAAQAIQTSSVDEAKRLSAQAAECYAAIQSR